MCFGLLLCLLSCLLAAYSIKPPPQSWYNFESNFTENRSAKEKFDSIWEMLTTNGVENPPYDNLLSLMKNLNLLPFLPGMKLPLLQSTSMFRPWKLDHKPFHTRPVYASVKLVFNEEAHEHYTGLFEADEVSQGLIAYSAGFKVPNMTNFFSFSIRLFRDEVPAGSIIAAFNALSQPNWNIFDYMVCTQYNWLMSLPLAVLTILPPGGGWTTMFNQFGLSNLALYKISGEKVADPKFPWCLCMIPGEAIRSKFTGTPPAHDAEQLLARAKEGDVLYDLWAIKEPFPLAAPALLKKYSHLIGRVELTSNFFTSTYGSQRLHGTHQRFEQDLIYRPDWRPYCTPFFLSRTGAVGVYSGLFSRPDPEIESGQKMLLLAMAGMWQAFTTTKGFRNFVDQLGLTPNRLYDSILRYLVHEVLPSRFHGSHSLSPFIEAGPSWAVNIINNVADYAIAAGQYPPLLPSQLGHLGRRAHKAIALVEDASIVEQVCRLPLVCEEGESTQDCNSRCTDNPTEMTKKTEEPKYDKSLHAGNTLFAGVRILPFHLNVFNS